MKKNLLFRKAHGVFAMILVMMLSTSTALAQRTDGPKKSNDDGVPFYLLPEGGFFSAETEMLNFLAGMGDKQVYYVVPAFAQVRFKNLMPETNYYWSYFDEFFVQDMGGENATIEDNGDFSIFEVAPTDCTALTNGVRPGSYYPVLNSNGNSFGGSLLGRVGSYPGDLCLSPIAECQPTGVGYLSTGYVLGTGDGSDGFVQVISKPAGTLYVESISAHVVSNTQPLSDGAILTMEICHVKQDSEGNDVLGTPFITLTASAADQSLEGQNGDLKTYGLVFRTAGNEPFVIDERFAVKVTGCSQDGVDVGFQVQQKRQEFVCPSVKRLTSDNELVEIDGFDNDMVAYILFDNAIFDHVSVTSNYDGTDVCRTFPNGSTTLVLLKTAEFYDWDSGAERYPILFLPDWITYEIDHSQMQWQSYGMGEYMPWGTSQFAMTFAPLPEGVNGRYCKLYFKGKGVISNPLTIIQGDVVVPEAGDLNYDAIVDVSDVNAVINLILNHSTRMDNPDADVNGDGIIDVADVNALINIILAN
ncbi:MAG: dockerin type I repeat-containing protein [Muribaculaceae bacterium]|nr:dockerin type I repeat-containing protein [Muribaculaceae bacterium]